jgi:hypothetical protein
MTPLTAKQQADVFYARISAVIDFANEVNAKLWRRLFVASVIASEKQANGSSTDNVRPVPAR